MVCCVIWSFTCVLVKYFSISNIYHFSAKDEISLADVPATQNMYTVSGLTADVLYKFTVQPVSDKDLGEEVTPWKEARPKKLGLVLSCIKLCKKKKKTVTERKIL